MTAQKKFFRVELNMDIEQGREREFEEVWLEVGRAVAKHPESIAQWLSVRQDNPSSYTIISDWPDEAAFRRFEKEPGHLELTRSLHALRKHGSMTTMDVLYHLPGEKAK